MWLARIALQDMPSIQTLIQSNITTVKRRNGRTGAQRTLDHLQGRNINTLNQGCTNPGCQVSMSTEFHMTAPNIWGFSVRN